MQFNLTLAAALLAAAALPAGAQTPGAPTLPLLAPTKAIAGQSQEE